MSSGGAAGGAAVPFPPPQYIKYTKRGGTKSNEDFDSFISLPKDIKEQADSETIKFKNRASELRLDNKFKVLSADILVGERLLNEKSQKLQKKEIELLTKKAESEAFRIRAENCEKGINQDIEKQDREIFYNEQKDLIVPKVGGGAAGEASPGIILEDTSEQLDEDIRRVDIVEPEPGDIPQFVEDETNLRKFTGEAIEYNTKVYNKLLAKAKNKILEERRGRIASEATVGRERQRIGQLLDEKQQIQRDRINNLSTLKTTILPPNQVKNILTDDVPENIFTPEEGENIEDDIQIPASPQINLVIDLEDANLDGLVSEKVGEFNRYVGDLLSRNKSIYDKTVRLAKRKIRSETARVEEEARRAELVQVRREAELVQVRREAEQAREIQVVEIARTNVQKQAAIDNGKRYLMGIKELIKGKLTQDGSIKNPINDNDRDIANINNFDINDTECNPDDDVGVCGNRIRTYVEDVVKKYKAKVKSEISEKQRENQRLTRERDQSREQSNLDSERAERAERIQIESQIGLLENENARARAEATLLNTTRQLENIRIESQQKERDKTAIYNKFKRILTPPRVPAPVPADGDEQQNEGNFLQFKNIEFGSDGNLKNNIKKYLGLNQDEDLGDSQNIISSISRKITEIQLQGVEYNLEGFEEFDEPQEGQEIPELEDIENNLPNYKFTKLLNFGTKNIKRNEILYKVLLGRALRSEFQGRNDRPVIRQRIEAELQDERERLQAQLEAARQERERLQADRASLQQEQDRLRVQGGGLREQLDQVGQIGNQLNQATQRIQVLEAELAKKSTIYKIKEGVKTIATTISEPIKKYYTEEGFSNIAKWIMFGIVSFCILFLILGIYYIVRLINDNRRFLKNKDKNEKIIKNLIKS